jgi:nucleotide-binding universal stress UspA family protein
MYKKVVIPLDGSNLAEEALSNLDEIADCTDVMLVTVTEKVTGEILKSDDRMISERRIEESPPRLLVWPSGGLITAFNSIVRDDPMEKITAGKMAKTALDYLNGVGEKLAEKGYDVTTKVLIGNPAEEIFKFADNQKADLILMAHPGGRPGLSRWDAEKIAEKIVEKSRVPVMLVKPRPGFKETKHKRKGVAT